MILPNEDRLVIPYDDADPKDLKDLVLHSEKHGRQIDRPSDEGVAKMLRQIVHGIIAERLIRARNRSGLNNDKINRLMLDAYLRRRREGKGWTFTNSVGSRSSYLPDSEEVEILSTILHVSEVEIGMHLSVLPWAIKDQRENAGPKRKRASRAKTSPGREPAPSKPANNPPISRQEDHPVMSAMTVPQNAGDLKISHSGDNLSVHGKVWCDRATAQRLRMIVPLKLIQQARGDDPWCYEIKGPVHSYQIYNLIHVLYGSPRVLQVQLD